MSELKCGMNLSHIPQKNDKKHKPARTASSGAQSGINLHRRMKNAGLKTESGAAAQQAYDLIEKEWNKGLKNISGIRLNRPMSALL